MVKLRLKRTGKKKQPSYQIVAIDARKKRDASYLEKIGHYFPLNQKYDLNKEKVLKWLKLGAQPTKTVNNILTKAKVWEFFHQSQKTDLTKKTVPSSPKNLNLSSNPTEEKL